MVLQVFPRSYSFVAKKAVSHEKTSRAVATPRARSPNKSYRNPIRASSEQSRGFPRQFLYFLVFFASDRFKGQSFLLFGQILERCNPYPRKLTQDRLRCPQLSPQDRFHAILQASPVKKSQVPRKYQSPREAGQRLHAIADRPNLLTPAISPQLGVASQ